MTAVQRPEFTRFTANHGGPIKPVNLTLQPTRDASDGGTIKTPVAMEDYEPTGFNEIDEKMTNVPPVHGGPIQLPLNFRGTYSDVDVIYPIKGEL